MLDCDAVAVSDTPENFDGLEKRFGLSKKERRDLRQRSQRKRGGNTEEKGAAQSRPYLLQGHGRLSGYGDVFAQVDVLDGVQEFYAFGHGTLEGFAAGDEAGAAGALVDDGGGDSVFEIVGAGSAAGIDEARAAHETVGDLVAGEIDGVIAGEIGVNALVEFAVAGVAHIESRVAAVIFGELLLDDVGLDGDAKMIGLPREVGGDVKVLVLFESVIAEVAPENGGHAEIVGFCEGLADFDDLAAALVGAEIDGGTNGGGTHFVGVLASDGTEDAVGGSDGVAAAFDGELDDVFTIEIVGILGEAGAGGVLDALVDGENGEIASIAEAAGAEEALKIGEHSDVAVGEGVDTIDEIGAGEMQAFLGDFWGFEAEKGFSLGAEELFDVV